jgi:hypothetical protein
MYKRVRGVRAVAATLLAVFALAAAAVAPAAAITDGSLDGNGHPYVGLMVALDSGNHPLWRCSGTLLSSEVFVTAGHCVASPAAHAELFFDTGPIPRGDLPLGQTDCTGHTGYPCTGDTGGDVNENPGWNPDAFYLDDVGIVTLDSPWVVGTYGELPDVGQLDSLHAGHSTTFTSVGYGLQRSFPTAAAFLNEGARTRYVAHPWLYMINTEFVGDFALLLSNNAAAGGTCFGDSGGPNFLGSSTTIAGVTSFGLNQECAGTGGVYRLDREVDRAWIESFL